jgi:hypothetical protein
LTKDEEVRLRILHSFQIIGHLDFFKKFVNINMHLDIHCIKCIIISTNFKI